MKRRSEKNPSEMRLNFRFAIQLLKKTDKLAFFLIVISAFFTYASQITAVWLSAHMTALISAGAPAAEIMKAAAALAVSVFALTMISRAVELAYNKSLEMFRFTEHKILSEILTGKDYALLEKPEFQEALHFYQTVMENNGGAFQSVHTGIRTMVTGVFGMIFSLVTIAPTVRGLLRFDGSSFISSWYFALVMLLIVAACAVFTTLLSNRHSGKMIKINEFYHTCFEKFTYWLDFPTRYKSGKDIRLYDSQGLVLREYQERFADEQENYRRYANRKIGLGLLGMGAMQGVITAAAYVFVAVRAFSGALTADDLVKIIGCVPIITGSIMELGQLPLFINYALAYIGYLRKVYEYPTERHMGTLPVEKRSDNQYDIEFKHVSFKYPGADIYALRDVSLQLKIGEHLAFVGHNGSGKSTFIKLLCRLYDPDEGEITLNGIDIRKYDMDEYMSLFGVVFQDFSLFSVPLSQNVTTSVDFDRAKLLDCLDKAGIGKRVQELPHREDTVLYKDFDEDGVEISGGEAQKLAIARALYRDAPFVVLDEPTAALDPISEFEIYRRFNSFTDGKTAIYISHRLSSCRFCDKIIVFQEGQIVQQGSHEALLAQDGAYSALWNAQAKYYVTAEQA